MLRMISFLKEQLAKYKSKGPTKSGLSMHSENEDKDLMDQRMKGLDEIFHFYSRQHIPQNKQFDDLKESMNEVDLGEFMKFCSDFSIPLLKSKITEIFKKSTQNNKSLKFEQFLIGLGKLGIEMNAQNIQNLSKQIQELKINIKQGQLNNAKGQSSLGNDLNEQLAILVKQKYDLEQKGDMEKAIDAFNFIDCHDPQKYRKKIKGFHIAFNIKEKELRMSNDERKRLNHKFKVKSE
mmetsp:Transcript_43234/g.41586  ORF Transcript_43234/g.41586 Transcript_43234/m.41586 type:complete len:236 (-) Transcript_43234:348-1055(-)